MHNSQNRSAVRQQLKSGDSSSTKPSSNNMVQVAEENSEPKPSFLKAITCYQSEDGGLSSLGEDLDCGEDEVYDPEIIDEEALQKLSH